MHSVSTWTGSSGSTSHPRHCRWCATPRPDRWWSGSTRRATCPRCSPRRPRPPTIPMPTRRPSLMRWSAAPPGDRPEAPPPDAGRLGSLLMRTLVVTQNVTLDGSIEFLGDWFDPTAEDADLAAETRRLSERGDALVLGRQTFEDFRSYWPKQTDDTTGVTDELNRIDKYVVSSTLTDPDW